MNLSDLFIRRPVMTSLVMLAITIFGVMAYIKLPVNDLPAVDYPTIQVSANLPGANPDTMATAVAMPLERELSTIAGLQSMSSTNGQGITRITLQFELDRSIDAAAQDVNSALSKAARNLPQDMPAPPSYQKVNPADQPVLYLAMSSKTLPLSTVNEYADTVIAQRVSMINGVALVAVYGSQKFAVRVQLDPKLLAARKIGIDEVAQALRSGNVNLPTGVMQGREQAFTVQATGQLYNAEAYKPLVVAYRNGAPVRLGDLGTVTDSVENDKVAAWYKGTRAIVLAVQRQPGTNTIDVVDAIKELLPGFRKQMPAAMDLEIMNDRTVTIRESVADVKFTLVLTIALVILVIFLFLRNLPATAIPSLAVPLSIVGTFAAMYMLGFSVNNISLMALTLSVGFVVDDAIVMLENIVRHMEKGEDVMTASFKGAREIGFTILSMTLSLVAVFLPVLFMGGMLGRILHEFAVTISVAILISGFVSLTLTPMLCSLFLKPHARDERHGRMYMAMERFFDGMLRLYERTLKAALRFRLAMVVMTIVMTVVTIWMFMTIPTGLLPSEDLGSVIGFTEASQGISFEGMVERQRAVADIAGSDPAVEGVMSVVGAVGSRVSGNSGLLFIKFKPHDQRAISADGYIQKMRPLFAKVPGIMVFLQNPPPIRLDATLAKAQYQFVLQSSDTQELYANAAAFETKLRGIPILLDLTSDLQMKNPQVTLDIDRDRASALGVTVQQIEDALFSSYSARQVSTIYAPSNQYRVVMELMPQYQRDPAALSMLYVRSSKGELVPLSTLCTLRRTLGPLSVNHLGQSTAVTISFNLKPGVPLGDAVSAIEKAARESLPASISTTFMGSAQVYKASTKGLALLLVVAIFVIYIVLGILYESYIHPVTILSGLPAAGIGALVTLLAFRSELNLYAFVGIIMLVGIVKKNAIMMIDFALDAQRNEGKAPLDAIYEGCLVRFRPIMMTTMAALMGALPIALGYGAGADARRPLGLSVVGGLVVSQLLTLYITPAIYYYLDRFQVWAGVRFRRDAAKETP